MFVFAVMVTDKRKRLDFTNAFPSSKSNSITIFMLAYKVKKKKTLQIKTKNLKFKTKDTLLKLTLFFLSSTFRQFL